MYYTYVYTGVLGGNVNILGGHSIGHSKQTMHMCMCPIPNGFRDRTASLYNSFRPHKGTSRCTQRSDTPCPPTKCKVQDVDGGIFENVLH
jgi:hypothetical protein